jgi:hypothetical protein
MTGEPDAEFPPKPILYHLIIVIDSRSVPWYNSSVRGMRTIPSVGSGGVIEVRLFGELQQYSGKKQPSGTVIYLPAATGETVGEILAHFGIDPKVVGNVFLNGRLMPRSIYPITLGYPLTSPVPLAADAFWSTQVRSGDRLGLFPHTMSVVVV